MGVRSGTVTDLKVGMKVSGTNVFSAFGFVCNVWKGMTGRGSWIEDCFSYESNHGGRVFSRHYIPNRIIDELFPKNTEVHKFMLRAQDDVVSFVNFFKDMDDLVIREQALVQKYNVQALVPSNPSLNWNYTIYTYSIEQAEREFKRQFPAAKIKSIVQL